MKDWRRRIAFNPPWWAIPVNAYAAPRRALAKVMKDMGGELRGKVLDVGCGCQPYRGYLTNAAQVVGLELESARKKEEMPAADVYYGGREFPFDDATFDSVLCNQVLEHVSDADFFLSEIRRVLKPGGMLLLSVPFVWPEHEQPADMRRFTSFGLRHAFSDAGFEVAVHHKLVAGLGALLSLLSGQINGKLAGFPAVVRIPLRIMVIGPLVLLACGWAGYARDSSNLYLDNFVVASKA